MVRVIPFGKLQKLWAASWGNAHFLFFLVSLADLATLCNFSFFREVKLNHLLFVDGFSNQMACVNGKHPWSCFQLKTYLQLQLQLQLLGHHTTARLLAELLCGQRQQSGAPWVKKFGNLSMREILVVKPAYVRTPEQTLGEGREVLRQPDWGWRMSSSLGEIRSRCFGAIGVFLGGKSHDHRRL